MPRWGIIVGSEGKLLKRLARKPSDFEWHEVESLLGGLGYELKKGSGSRRKFHNPRTGHTITIDEPHPARILKKYLVNRLYKALMEQGYYDK